MSSVPRMSHPQQQTLTQPVPLSLHSVILILAELTVTPAGLIEPSFQTGKVHIRHRSFTMAGTYQNFVGGIGLADSADHGGDGDEVWRSGFGSACDAGEGGFGDGILLPVGWETAFGRGRFWLLCDFR